MTATLDRPVTMIRLATVEDVPAIVAMGMHFGTAVYADRLVVNAACLDGLARRTLANPDAALWVSEDGTTVTGMIAMLLYEHPMSGELIASEIVWWVDPSARGAGIRLLRAAEDWATERGAAAIHMIAPTERVGRFYHALGYLPTETIWQRRI